jgi:hypothetical protein
MKIGSPDYELFLKLMLEMPCRLANFCEQSRCWHTDTTLGLHYCDVEQSTNASICITEAIGFMLVGRSDLTRICLENYKVARPAEAARESTMARIVSLYLDDIAALIDQAIGRVKYHRVSSS